MKHYSYTTQRLILKEWQSYSPQELKNTPLQEIIQAMLIPEITADFPIMWRGKYNIKRTKFWIEERDREGTTLLALEKYTHKPIGFLHFFYVGKPQEHKNLRLGYIITKEEWNRGYATEIVNGFIQRLKHESIGALYAGVSPKNSASKKVLEKCGFKSNKKDTNAEDLLFELSLYSRITTQNSKRESHHLHSY